VAVRSRFARRRTSAPAACRAVRPRRAVAVGGICKRPVKGGAVHVEKSAATSSRRSPAWICFRACSGYGQDKHNLGDSCRVAFEAVLPLGNFRFWRSSAGRCFETGARWSDCGSRKLDLRALGYGTTGLPIQHTRLARLLRGAVISRDPDFTGGDVVVTQTGLQDPQWPCRRNGPSMNPQ
jgi:hypothetical protein